ncbi:tetratricopeptide repeat protein [Caldithrix abyssi]
MVNKIILGIFICVISVLGNIQQKLIEARAAERNHDYSAAIKLYQQVLMAEFTSKEAWQGLLRTEAAKEVQALMLPRDSDTWSHQAGKIYLKYYQYPTAIHFLQKAYQTQKKQNYLFDLATAYLKAGFNNKCISILNAEAQKHSNDGLYLKGIAEFYFKNRLYGQAAKFFEQSLKFKIQSDTLYTQYARCLENLGRLEEAEKLFEKGVKQFKTPFIYTEFTRFFIRANQFEKALKIAEKSEDEFNTVEVYLKLKGRPAVIEYFRQLQKKNPYHLAYYIWIAELYSLEQQYQQAEKVLKEGLIRFPTNEQMWESLAKVYTNLEEFDRALDVYKKRLPQNTPNLKQQLRLYLLKKDLKNAQKIINQLKTQKALSDQELAGMYEKNFPVKAEEIYSALLKTTPQDARLLNQYFNFLKKQRNYDRAIHLVLQHAPQNVSWLIQNGSAILRFLCLNGYGEKATELAHQFILAQENWKNILSPQVYQPYLTTLRWTGANREYFVFLEILLEFDPDNHALYQEIAQLYEQNENWKEALYYYRKLLKENPHDVFLRYKMATMYAKMDQRQRGLQVLGKSISTQKRSPLELYYLSRFYYEQGYFEQALAIINQIVGKKISPEAYFDDPYGFELKTEILEASGKLTDAFNTLEQYVREFPNELQSHQLLAEYLYRHGDFMRAEAEYKKIFQLNPQNFTVLRRIALCMVYQNKVKEAYHFLEEQIKASPYINEEDIDYYKGYVAHIMNDYPTALRYYQTALQKNANNSHILLLQGILYEETEELEAALRVFKTALARDSAFTRYDKLGDIYRHMHDYKKALNYYALYRNVRPNDLSVFPSIAICYKGLGNEEEIYNLIGMLQSFPESPERALQEARLYELLENFVVAERNYLRSILLQSGVTPALRSLAQLYIKMGNFLEAEVWTRKYFEAAPQSPYNMDLMGAYYMESQDFISAEYWFRKINNDIPWYYFARNNLGLVYLHKGDYQKAREILKELSAAHPEHSAFRRNLALGEIRLNHLSDANSIYLNLIKERPYNLKNYIEYVRFMLFFKNDVRRARDVLNTALKMAPHNKELKALDYLLMAYEGKAKQAISGLLDLQTYYNDNNRHAQGTLALYLSLAYEKNKDIKTRNEYLAIAQKMDPNDFWIDEIHARKAIPLKVVAISEKPEVIAAQQKQGLMDTFQKYEDRFTSLELNDRFSLSQVSTEKVKEKIDKQSEFDVSIAPDNLRHTAGLKLIQAPKIIITAPKDGHHTRASSINVEGFITQGKKPVAFDLNGKKITEYGKNVKIQKMPDPETYPNAIPFRVTDFPLVPGANFLTVHAKFKDNYETQNTIRVGRIAKLLYAFETIPKRAKGVNRWALIVSNEDYEDPRIQDLPNAQYDVDAFKRFLTASNGLDIPESNILTLSLSTGIQPTRSAVIDGIKTIARYVEPQDEVIIFYVGNALIINNGSGSQQSFTFLMQDSQIDKLYSTGINMEFFHLICKSIPAYKVSCFLEANLFENNSNRLEKLTALSPIKFDFADNNKEPYVNILIMGNGLTTTPSNAAKPSRFTSNLIKALKGAADSNKDKKITFDEIFNYLKARIRNHEIVLGNFQHKMTLFGLQN